MPPATLEDRMLTVERELSVVASELVEVNPSWRKFSAAIHLPEQVG